MIQVVLKLLQVLCCIKCPVDEIHNKRKLEALITIQKKESS